MFEYRARWVCGRCCNEATGNQDRQLPEGWIVVSFDTSQSADGFGLDLCPACVDRVLRVVVDEAPPHPTKPAGTVLLETGAPRHRSALISLFSDARRSSE